MNLFSGMHHNSSQGQFGHSISTSQITTGYFGINNILTMWDPRIENISYKLLKNCIEIR